MKFLLLLPRFFTISLSQDLAVTQLTSTISAELDISQIARKGAFAPAK